MTTVVLASGTSWTALSSSLSSVSGWGGGGGDGITLDPNGCGGGAWTVIKSVSVNQGIGIPYVIGSGRVNTNWNSGQLIAASASYLVTGGATTFACTPSTGAYSGGHGTLVGQGGAGGGSGGPDGNGQPGNLNNSGGTGDNGLGGAGGSIGANGTSNTLGGGGGGGALEVSFNNGGNGGVPGGGGGAGGALGGAVGLGGGGQIQIVYAQPISTNIAATGSIEVFTLLNAVGAAALPVVGSVNVSTVITAESVALIAGGAVLSSDANRLPPPSPRETTPLIVPRETTSLIVPNRSIILSAGD